ncbi:MAG: SDR family NAD(P)-dependent oxidoreductase, partial [Planctomycetota bacterium]
MLKDKIAFITGGSGAVGQAIVRAMAREDCKIAYSYKDGTQRAEQLDKELTAAGIEVKSYVLDVTDSKASTELAKQVEEELGPVDILVNNAGVAQIMPFAMIEEEDWDMMMNV